MKFETKKHTLECPVEIDVLKGTEGGEFETVTLTEVTISTPKGKKMREIMRLVSKVQADPIAYSEGDMTMDSIQIMSDMPPGGIDELHPRDITVLGDITAPFLETVMGGGPSSQTSPNGSATTKPK